MTQENEEVQQADSGEKYGLAETPFSGFAASNGDGTEEPRATEPVGEEIVAEASDEPEAPAAEEVLEPAAVEAVAPAEEQAQEPEKEMEAAVVEEAPPAAEAPRVGKKEEPTGQVDYGDTFKTLSEGDVVDGVVVHIDREGVLVDVGAKSEGIIRPDELSRSAYANPEDVVSVGEHIDVYVMRSESGDENLLLSKKRADFEQAWNRVEEAHKDKRVLTAMVSDRVKGGLVVDLGIRGFVPGSHVGSGKLKNLDKFVGQSLPLKVIEVDRERRKVVLSHRLAIEEDRASMRGKTLAEIKEGEIRDGVIRRMTDYGAFVDLGGIDGLLHISEMSWTRINHPSEVLKVGEKIQVVVLKLNLDQGRVSLGLRQILPDPWMEVAKSYRIGDTIQGKISRLVPFGAFVQVTGGVEGIIPNAELAVRRVSKPEEVVSVGQDIEAKIVDLRVEERRMTLSIRHIQQAKEREQLSAYTQQTRTDQRTTVGDLVGEALSAAAKRSSAEEKREEEAEKEMEAPKPKPKKRASKAERRAQEEEPAGEEEPAPVEAAEPEAVVEEAPEVAVEAAVEEPQAEEPAAEPVAEVVAEEPAAEEAIAEQVAEEPAAEAAEEPVAEAAVEEPVAETVVEEQAAEEAAPEPEKNEEEPSA